MLTYCNGIVVNFCKRFYNRFSNIVKNKWRHTGSAGLVTFNTWSWSSISCFVIIKSSSRKFGGPGPCSSSLLIVHALAKCSLNRLALSTDWKNTWFEDFNGAVDLFLSFCFDRYLTILQHFLRGMNLSIWSGSLFLLNLPREALISTITLFLRSSYFCKRSMYDISFPRELSSRIVHECFVSRTNCNNLSRDVCFMHEVIISVKCCCFV